ncbi:MAG: hypothetical protein R6T98_01225 [Desulfatiglandales bacterium]
MCYPIIPVFFLLELPSYLSASIKSSISFSDNAPMKKSDLITARQTISQAIATVLKNGIIPKYMTKILGFSRKIVVDIFYSMDLLSSITIPVKGSIVNRVKV